MKIEDVISIEQLIAFCKKHDIVYLAVFGSMATGTATAKSDLDLLVRFRETVCKPCPFDF